MERRHHYTTQLKWTGNKGKGTQTYTAYERNHTISVDGKPVLLCSSDPNFRGDKTMYNPEELLVASLSSCHMLWFLHLCANAGIIVVDYNDNATGTMIEDADGSGRFSEVILHPYVTVMQTEMIEKANALHQKANKMCFIANSCNFPVRHQPVCIATTLNLDNAHP